MKYIRYIAINLIRFVQQMFIGFVRGNASPIAGHMRSVFFQTPCMIDTNVYITSRKNFSADIGSALYHSCYILNRDGLFVLGKNSHLGAFCYINVCYGEIHIGEDVAIGPGTKIIAYSNHYREGKKITQEKIVENITIGNNVFVGANCTILPGTIIQDNVVVGAGSIIKGALESNSIYAGVPCRKIKSGWYA